MQPLLAGLSGVCGIVSLVCFILVIVQMFQHGQTGLGVACIVLVLCFGVGGLIAFIVGWINARTWNIGQTMWIWTLAIVIGTFLGGVRYALLIHV